MNIDHSSSPGIDAAVLPEGSPIGFAADRDVGFAPPQRQPEMDQRLLRKERRLMKILQNPVLGRALRQFVDPQDVLHLGMSFWSSRVVLTAVEFGVFTHLAGKTLSADELRQHFGWNPRASTVFLDALVAVGLLKRNRRGLYKNSQAAALFLDRQQPSYIGGLMELSSTRLYALWNSLGDLLKTGAPGASEERGDNEFFSTLYQDPVALEQFLAGMTGISTGEAILIASLFPWKKYRTFADIGGAQGALSVRVALTHPHITGISYDLAAVQPIYEKYAASFGLQDRLKFVPGDMNVGPFPTADVITMGHLLHGYGVEKRRELIGKAFAALPPGGALIVYDAMIDNDARNMVGLLSSLNIMLETRDGFEARISDCRQWFADAGFEQIQHRAVIGPTTMVHGVKPSRHPLPR
jgi:precorrin-6B methylase 2